MNAKCVLSLYKFQFSKEFRVKMFANSLSFKKMIRKAMVRVVREMSKLVLVFMPVWKCCESECLKLYSFVILPVIDFDIQSLCPKLVLRNHAFEFSEPLLTG